MADLTRFSGGVHPPEGKAATSGSAIVTAPLLPTYLVPFLQAIGAPPTPLVKKGDKVLRGQVLATASAAVSAPVHAPTSGTVKDVMDVASPAGRLGPCAWIEADGEDRAADPMAPVPTWQEADPEALRKRVADAGIVGMGGAAFPTAVKLAPPPSKPIDTLILNGVECEPCLTADHRLMMEEPDRILAGAGIMARVLKVKRILVGIEANKPDAIRDMTARAAAQGIQVRSLPVRYPQGAEKQLIYALTGRKVPTGGLPMDVGVVVQNVGTAFAVAQAVMEGTPCHERVTTVTGTPVVRPGNWRLRVGTSLAKAISLAGGTQGETAKLICGGPMMGQAVYSLDLPVVKSTSGILLLAPAEVAQYTSHPCIRCGRCVDVCPMNLMAGTLSVEIENERYDLAEADHAMDCIECGCCAFACPANRPLVQHLRRAKQEILASRRARAAKAKN